MLWPSTRTAAVSVAGQPSESVVGVFDIAIVTRVTGVSAPSFPVAGGVSVGVIGEGFGGLQADVRDVTLDGVSVSSFSVVSALALRFELPPGVGANLPLVVHMASGATSPPVSVSYDRPELASVDPPFGLAGTLNASFTLCGTDLGLVDAHIDWVRLGGHAMETVRLLNASCLLVSSIQLPDAWSAPDEAAVSVGGQTAVRTQGLFEGVPRPSIALLSALVRPTAGGGAVSVFGEGFGRSSGDVWGVEVGSSVVMSSEVTFVSRRELRFSLPAGVGSSVGVRVRSRSGVWSNALSFAYDRPVVTSVSPSVLLVGPKPRIVVVRGANFGHRASDFSRVTLGGVPCASIRPIDTSAFECEGFTAVVDEWPEPGVVVVEVAGVGSGPVQGEVTTLDRPRVKRVNPMEIVVGDQITITGSGFGLAREHVQGVRFGNWSCSDFTWASPSEVTCTMRTGHPLFESFAKPENSSEVENWAFVTVELVTGATSFLPSELDEEESLVPRVAPRSWISTKFPKAKPVVTRAVREVGRHETILVEWEVDGADLMSESPTLRVTGFRVEGVDTDNRTVASFNQTAAFNSSELAVPSRTPIKVKVIARNSFGDGPPSEPSELVFENCEATRFLATHRDLRERQCEECPSEAVFGGLGSGNVTARSGFWRVPWSAFELGFATCKRPASCRGFDGEPVSTDTSASTRFVAVPGLALDPAVLEGCAEGHEGVLCEACERGSFKDAMGACQPCGSSTWVILRVLGLLVLAMVLLGVLLFRAYKSAGESSNGIIRTLKILFNHFQTIAIISSIGFQWPSSVADTFAVSNTATSFGVEGVSLECVMGDAGYDPMGRSLVSISTPVWLVLYAAAFWAAEVLVDWDKMVEAVRRKSSFLGNGASSPPSAPRRHTILGTSTAPNSTRDRWVRRMKVSLPVLIFLVHTSVTKAAFEMVTCENVAPDDDPSNTQLRLSMSLDTRCDDPSALRWMIGVAVPVLLLFSVGVPIVTILTIGRFRARLGEPEPKRLFGFLFFGFRGGFEGWEGVNVLRKVLLAGVTVVLGPFGAFNQVGATLTVILCFMAAHAWYRPYTDARFNRLEMASLLASCVTMIAGLFIEGSGSEAVAMFVAPAAIFVANLVFLALVGWQFASVLRRSGVQGSEAVVASAPTAKAASPSKEARTTAAITTTNPILGSWAGPRASLADRSLAGQVTVRRGRQ